MLEMNGRLRILYIKFTPLYYRKHTLKLLSFQFFLFLPCFGCLNVLFVSAVLVYFHRCSVTAVLIVSLGNSLTIFSFFKYSFFPHNKIVNQVLASHLIFQLLYRTTSLYRCAYLKPSIFFVWFSFGFGFKSLLNVTFRTQPSACCHYYYCYYSSTMPTVTVIVVACCVRCCCYCCCHFHFLALTPTLTLTLSFTLSVRLCMCKHAVYLMHKQ